MLTKISIISIRFFYSPAKVKAGSSDPALLMLLFSMTNFNAVFSLHCIDIDNVIFAGTAFDDFLCDQGLDVSLNIAFHRPCTVYRINALCSNQLINSIADPADEYLCVPYAR